MKFYSQEQSDQIIYEKYYKDTPLKNGVFLEVGALDGVIYSNTKFFEDTLDWTGVLIEAVPMAFEKLEQNRPNCKLYNYVVTSKPEKEVNFVTGDLAPEWPTSGMRDTMSDYHFDTYCQNLKTLKLPTRRLDSIIADSGFDHFDLMVIDVEGGEYDLLLSFDWKTPVHLLCIEAHPKDKEKNEKVRALLRSHDFRLVGTIGTLDELWESKGWIDKNEK